MYRILVVALLLVIFAARTLGQSSDERSRISGSQNPEVSYELQTTEDFADSVAESGTGNATALRANSPRNHEQLVKDYMRQARTHDNNGNLLAARAALEKMRGELTYIDDPR